MHEAPAAGRVGTSRQGAGAGSSPLRPPVPPSGDALAAGPGGLMPIGAADRAIARIRATGRALLSPRAGIASRRDFGGTYRLIATLGVILLVGFVAVNVVSFQVSREAVRKALVNNELPLTSDNIYSEIQASLLRPIYISSLMAHDTFLKDWMLEGERDQQKVVRYLREIRQRYDVFSTFVVSALTMRYYHFNGILKEMSPSVAKDQWFFTMAGHDQGYRVDVDANEAAANRLTIFVNHKIHDTAGRFIGVAGLGLDVATVAQLIEHYRARYGRNIYFVDRQGTVKSHSDERIVDEVNIRDGAGIAAVADEILAGDQGSLSYVGDQGRIFLCYRYIPELAWFLIVEESEEAALATLRRALYVNILIGGSITLLVLLVSGFTVHRFQERLERLASIDRLSGLFNRHFFEILFANALSMARRYRQDLSLLLFDIDLFKQINDRHGHMAGDEVIRRTAAIVKQSRRATDIASRWGGDEFMILLSDCDEPNARRIAEELRRKIQEEVRVVGGDRPVTISVGVAAYRHGEGPEELIARVDARLYAAKEAGRNRVA